MTLREKTENMIKGTASGLSDENRDLLVNRIIILVRNETNTALEQVKNFTDAIKKEI